MPQGPIAVLQTPPLYGTATTLYVTGTQVIKATPGIVCKVNVIVAGAAGGIYDCATTAAIATANEIASVPATAGPLSIEFPCLVGITYKPGSGQVISISYV